MYDRPNSVQKQHEIQSNNCTRSITVRVAWKGLDTTRARRTNTAKCAPNMLMHHRHGSVNICIRWKFQPHIQQQPKQLKIEIDEKNNEKNNQENATTPAIHETSIETSSLFRPLRPQPKQNVETPMLKLV